HDDDDVGAIDSGREIGRDTLDRGKAGLRAIDVDAAAGADLREAAVVEVVEAQFAAEEAEFGGEIDAADARADECDRRVGPQIDSPRQLRPISPSMTCSNPISGMRNVIFGLSTVVSDKRRAVSALRTASSISRCEVTPTVFRNLRISMLKRSSFIGASMQGPG